MRADIRRVAEHIEPWLGQSAQIERYDGRRQQRGNMAPQDMIYGRSNMRPRLCRHIFEQRQQALARFPGEDVFNRYSRRGETIGGQHQTASRGMKGQGAA